MSGVGDSQVLSRRRERAPPKSNEHLLPLGGSAQPEDALSGAAAPAPEGAAARRSCSQLAGGQLVPPRSGGNRPSFPDQLGRAPCLLHDAALHQEPRRSLPLLELKPAFIIGSEKYKVLQQRGTLVSVELEKTKQTLARQG